MMCSVRRLHNVVQRCQVVVVACQEYKTVSCRVFEMTGIGSSSRSAFGRNDYSVADLPQKTRSTYFSRCRRQGKDSFRRQVVRRDVRITVQTASVEIRRLV